MLRQRRKHAQRGSWVQTQSRERTPGSVPQLELAESAESFPGQVL